MTILMVQVKFFVLYSNISISETAVESLESVIDTIVRNNLSFKESNSSGAADAVGLIEKFVFIKLIGPLQK